MSINPRQWIVQTLYNDLNKIKVINGYNYDIQEVFKNYINPGNIPIPAIWFELIAESKNNESESRRFFNSQLTILIGAYTSIPNNELRNVADCSEKMIADLMACINKVKLQSSTLDTFPSKIKWDIKSIEPYLNPELQGIVENRIFVNIEYLDSPDIISRLNNDLPDTPTLASPSNGGEATTLYPQFDWNSVNGALSYQILISSDSSFNSVYINQNYLITNSYTVPLDNVLTNGSTYYWKVRAYNNNGYSNWSDTRSFIVNSTDITVKNPLEIGSCTFWLDTLSSTSFTISSGAISQWFDKSGNGRHFSQATAGARPALSGDTALMYNSISSVSFAGNSQSSTYRALGCTGSVSAAFSISGTQTRSFMFTLTENVGGTGVAQMLCSRGNNSIGNEWGIYLPTNFGSFPSQSYWQFPSVQGGFGSIIIGADRGTPRQVRQLIVTISNSSGKAYINGTLVASNSKCIFTNQAPGESSFAYFILGSGRMENSSAGALSGNIYNAAGWNKELTQSEVNSLYAYHQQIFGL